MYGYYGYGYINDSQIVRPIQDGSVIQFLTQGSSSHYQNVDDGVNQPTISGTSDYNYAELHNDDDIDEYVISNPSLKNIYKIRLWMLAQDESSDGLIPRCNIKINGTWQAVRSFNMDDSLPSETWKWYYLDWTGTWSSINNLQVRLQAELSMATSEVMKFAVVYCEVFGQNYDYTFFDV